MTHTSPHLLANALFAALLSAVTLTTGACDDAAGHDGCADETAEVTPRQGVAHSGITVNTSNWVSAGARDIYEFDRTGEWVTNSYGFKTRLREIVFEDPQLGKIITNVTTATESTFPRVEVSSDGSLEVNVYRAEGEEPDAAPTHDSAARPPPESILDGVLLVY